jgi:hypothetical protein
MTKHGALLVSCIPFAAGHQYNNGLIVEKKVGTAITNYTIINNLRQVADSLAQPLQFRRKSLQVFPLINPRIAAKTWKSALIYICDCV